VARRTVIRRCDSGAQYACGDVAIAAKETDMTDIIVARLRQTFSRDVPDALSCLAYEAADKLERQSKEILALRAELGQQAGEVEHLRVALREVLVSEGDANQRRIIQDALGLPVE
jgi:hypothetical protein